MKLTEPHWYDALQGNPLKEKTFTKQLAARIKAEALSTQAKKPPGVRYLFIFGAGMVCLLGLLFMYRIDIFAFTQNQHQGTASITEPQPIISVEIPPKALSDNEWQDVINQSSKEKTLILKESLIDGRMLLFSKHSSATGVTLLADLMEWDSSQWKVVQSGTYYEELTNAEEDSNQQLTTGWLGLDTTTIFMGTLLNPAISQIRVSDDQQQEMATIVRGEDGNTYWFATLLDRRGRDTGYKVESLDELDNVLTSDPYFYQ